ncbi:hypothetical protein Tco_0627704 [Tanacetum coccineum]|uniref:Uncharacterized protein n=1 Tax=Tanacetum coccineum TaxID=301880 RepID=A0ABQ4WNB6_9ASTR
MRTKTELTLEQTQQGVSNEVLKTGSRHIYSETPKLLSGMEDSHHGPSDAMHNPSSSLKVSQNDFLFCSHGDYTFSIGTLSLELVGFDKGDRGGTLSYWFTHTEFSALRRSGNPDGSRNWYKTRQDS